MHFGRGLRGGVIIGKKKLLIFFHVSEHVDHFKAIKVFSLRKKPKITGKVWSGGTPPPRLVKHQTFSVFSYEGFPKV